MVLRGVDFGTAKVPVVGSFCAFPLRVVFPTMAYERVTDDYLHPRVFLSVFMIGFLICFGLQAVLAAQAGTLGRFDGTFGPVPDPGGGPDRVMFLNDLHNLLCGCRPLCKKFFIWMGDRVRTCVRPFVAA